jgi:hypothetical protein
MDANQEMSNLIGAENMQCCHIVDVLWVPPSLPSPRATRLPHSPRFGSSPCILKLLAQGLQIS